MSGIDFTALGTGMDIRQALDVLEAKVTDGTDDGPAAIATVRARLEELEQRLNTARRTAWVAVPVEAATIAAGDTIVAKNGELRNVQWVSPVGPLLDGKLKVMTQSGIYAATSVDVRPDYLVPVLRRPTADALDILMRQLGAQVTK